MMNETTETTWNLYARANGNEVCIRKGVHGSYGEVMRLARSIAYSLGMDGWQINAFPCFMVQC